jgi:predicted nucleic acid-binding protein
MSGLDFLDTNVLVYALDVADPRKHRIARPFLSKAVVGEFVTSTQVLAELANSLLQKFQSKFTADDVLTILGSLKPIPLVKPDVDMVCRAVAAHAAYGIHFYDGMIVAAAERAGSEKIMSEDLNAGQEYFGVTVVNPFV